VVAGWSLHYTFLSATNTFAGMESEAIGSLFGRVYSNAAINLFWHLVVMTVTIGVVIGGVSGGIETAVKFLMPALMVLMTFLMVDAVFQRGFGPALEFIFAPRAEELSAEGFLEALGHGFFTLSLGMGAMITYGSYLREDDDIPSSSVLIGLLDTFVALAACLIIFPIIFTFDLEPDAGPGLVFGSIPIALNQMTAGGLLSVVFFALLFFAALSSAISLLEVVTATVIDQFGWDRTNAAIGMGLAITVVGIPSALSGSTDLFGDDWASVFFGKTFFDCFDWLSSAVLLPLGGFLIAVYTGWVMPEDFRRREFMRGSRFGAYYGLWRFMIRWVSPAAVFVVFLASVVPRELWLE
jgi:NSS family neurotransmitter:Na+ symporter